MSYSDLAPEIVLHIAYLLAPADINSLLKTSSWHSSLLTPVLYDRAFNFDTTPRAQMTFDSRFDGRVQYELTDTIMAELSRLSQPDTPGKFSMAMWRAASRWKTPTLAKYLLGRANAVFITPLGMNHESTSYREEEVSLLEVMIFVANVALLRLLLAQDDVRARDLNRVNLYGHTPLTIAIENRDLVCFQMLLDAGADPIGQGNPPPRNILCIAAGRKNVEILKLALSAFLAAGGDVNIGGEREDYTPLHFAVRAELEEHVEILLDAGADLWAGGDPGNLPIQQVLTNQTTGLAKKLLDKMFPSDTGRHSGWKEGLLHHIVGKGVEKYIDLIPILVAHGADVTAPNRYDITSLDAVDRWGSPLFPSNEPWPGKVLVAQDVAGMLLAAEPHLWPEGHINRQLWELAREGWVEQYHLMLLSTLVRTGKSAIEIGPEDSFEAFTALHYICASPPPSARARLEPSEAEAKDLKMVAALIKSGADITAQSAYRAGVDTPLFCAACRGRTELVRMLLQSPRAADTVNVGRQNGETPLFGAAQAGDLVAIRLLLDAGANVQAVNESGRNIVLWMVQLAYQVCDLAALRLLISAGCSATMLTSRGESALHLAASRETPDLIDIIRILVDAGCSIHARDAEGRTVLYEAVSRANAAFVEELIRIADCDIVELEDKGRGNLVCASLNHWNTNTAKITADILIQHGARVNRDCEHCMQMIACLKIVI